MPNEFSCPVCGDAIGVYEAVVVVTGERGPRISSVAAEPGLCREVALVMHRDCGLARAAAAA